jgi:pyruvate/2-oxoglutarate dehydrogenase complex dihydrolipoamide acyltransferase (E2) component
VLGRLRLASAAPSSHSFATSSRDESAAGQQKAGEASSTAAAAAEAEEELVPHTFVTVPAFSDDTIKVSVTEWFAEEGARLADGAALCEVETHEIVADVDVERGGFLAKILVPAGASGVPVGEDLAIIVDEAEHVAHFAAYGEPGEQPDEPEPAAAAAAEPAAAAAAGGAAAGTIATAVVIDAGTSGAVGVTGASGAMVLRLINQLQKDGTIEDREFAKQLKSLARHDNRGLLMAYDGSVGGEGEFDTEFFMDNAVDIVEEEEEGAAAAVAAAAAAPAAPPPQAPTE